MKSKIILVVLFILVHQAVSQGLYLDRGKSGAGGFAGYSASKNDISMVASVGYSLSGMVDLQYSYGRTITERIYPHDIAGNLQSVNLAVQLSKQDTLKKLVSIGINLGCSWVEFKDRGFSYDMGSSNNLLLGINLSKKLMFNSRIGIVWSLNYSYAFTSHSGISSYGIQVAIINKGSKKLTMVAGPSISATVDQVTFGLSVGVIYIPSGE